MAGVNDLSMANSSMETSNIQKELDRPLSPIIMSVRSLKYPKRHGIKRKSCVNLAERFQSKSETAINENPPKNQSSFISALNAVDRIKKLEQLERERQEMYDFLSQNSPEEDRENTEFNFKRPGVPLSARKCNKNNYLVPIENVDATHETKNCKVQNLQDNNENIAIDEFNSSIIDSQFIIPSNFDINTQELISCAENLENLVANQFLVVGDSFSGNQKSPICLNENVSASKNVLCGKNTENSTFSSEKNIKTTTVSSEKNMENVICPTKNVDKSIYTSKNVDDSTIFSRNLQNQTNLTKNKNNSISIGKNLQFFNESLNGSQFSNKNIDESIFSCSRNPTKNMDESTFINKNYDESILSSFKNLEGAISPNKNLGHSIFSNKNLENSISSRRNVEHAISPTKNLQNSTYQPENVKDPLLSYSKSLQFTMNLTRNEENPTFVNKNEDILTFTNNDDNSQFNYNNEDSSTLIQDNLDNSLNIHQNMDSPILTYKNGNESTLSRFKNLENLTRNNSMTQKNIDDTILTQKNIDNSILTQNHMENSILTQKNVDNSILIQKNINNNLLLTQENIDDLMFTQETIDNELFTQKYLIFSQKDMDNNSMLTQKNKNGFILSQKNLDNRILTQKNMDNTLYTQKNMGISLLTQKNMDDSAFPYKNMEDSFFSQDKITDNSIFIEENVDDVILPCAKGFENSKSTINLEKPIFPLRKLEKQTFVCTTNVEYSDHSIKIDDTSTYLSENSHNSMLSCQKSTENSSSENMNYTPTSSVKNMQTVSLRNLENSSSNEMEYVTSESTNQEKLYFIPLKITNVQSCSSINNQEKNGLFKNIDDSNISTRNNESASCSSFIKNVKSSTNCIKNVNNSTHCLKNVTTLTNDIKPVKNSINCVKNDQKGSTNDIKNIKSLTNDIKNVKSSTNDIKNVKSTTNDIKNVKSSKNDIKNGDLSTNCVKNNNNAMNSTDCIKNIKSSTNCLQNKITSENSIKNVKTSTKFIGNLTKIIENVENLSRNIDKSIKNIGNVKNLRKNIESSPKNMENLKNIENPVLYNENTKNSNSLPILHIENAICTIKNVIGANYLMENAENSQLSLKANEDNLINATKNLDGAQYFKNVEEANYFKENVEEPHYFKENVENARLKLRTNTENSFYTAENIEDPNYLNIESSESTLKQNSRNLFYNSENIQNPNIFTGKIEYSQLTVRSNAENLFSMTQNEENLNYFIEEPEQISIFTNLSLGTNTENLYTPTEKIFSTNQNENIIENEENPNYFIEEPENLSLKTNTENLHSATENVFSNTKSEKFPKYFIENEKSPNYFIGNEKSPKYFIEPTQNINLMLGTNAENLFSTTQNEENLNFFIEESENTFLPSARNTQNSFYNPENVNEFLKNDEKLKSSQQYVENPYYFNKNFKYDKFSTKNTEDENFPIIENLNNITENVESTGFNIKENTVFSREYNKEATFSKKHKGSYNFSTKKRPEKIKKLTKKRQKSRNLTKNVNHLITNRTMEKYSTSSSTSNEENTNFSFKEMENSVLHCNERENPIIQYNEIDNSISHYDKIENTNLVNHKKDKRYKKTNNTKLPFNKTKNTMLSVQEIEENTILPCNKQEHFNKRENVTSFNKKEHAKPFNQKENTTPFIKIENIKSLNKKENTILLNERETTIPYNKRENTTPFTKNKENLNTPFQNTENTILTLKNVDNLITQNTEDIMAVLKFEEEEEQFNNLKESSTDIKVEEFPYLYTWDEKQMELFLNSVKHENELKKNILSFENRITEGKSQFDKNVSGDVTQNSSEINFKRKRVNEDKKIENENFNACKKVKSREDMLGSRIRCIEEENRIEISLNNNISINIKCQNEKNVQNAIPLSDNVQYKIYTGQNNERLTIRNVPNFEGEGLVQNSYENESQKIFGGDEKPNFVTANFCAISENKNCVEYQQNKHENTEYEHNKNYLKSTENYVDKSTRNSVEYSIQNSVDFVKKNNQNSSDFQHSKTAKNMVDFGHKTIQNSLDYGHNKTTQSSVNYGQKHANDFQHSKTFKNMVDLEHKSIQNSLDYGHKYNQNSVNYGHNKSIQNSVNYGHNKSVQNSVDYGQKNSNDIQHSKTLKNMVDLGHKSNQNSVDYERDSYSRRSARISAKSALKNNPNLTKKSLESKSKKSPKEQNLNKTVKNERSHKSYEDNNYEFAKQKIAMENKFYENLQNKNCKPVNKNEILMISDDTTNIYSCETILPGKTASEVCKKCNKVKTENVSKHKNLKREKSPMRKIENKPNETAKKNAILAQEIKKHGKLENKKDFGISRPKETEVIPKKIAKTTNKNFENETTTSIPSSSESFVGFVTGYSKKAVKISELALGKAKMIAMECYDNFISSSSSTSGSKVNSSPKKDNLQQNSGNKHALFSLGSGKPIKIAENHMKNAKKLHMDAGKQVPASFDKSAHGKNKMGHTFDNQLVKNREKLGLNQNFNKNIEVCNKNQQGGFSQQIGQFENRNFENEALQNKHGSFENKRNNFQNVGEQNNFENRQGTFQNNANQQLNFEHRHSNFEHRGSNFENKHGNFQDTGAQQSNNENRQSHFENRSSDFENKNSSFANNGEQQSKFENRQSNYENRQSNYENRQSNFENRQSNFESRHCNFENVHGNIDNIHSNFQNNQHQLQNIEVRHVNFESRNFDNNKNQAANFGNFGNANKHVNFENNQPKNPSNQHLQNQNIEKLPKNCVVLENTFPNLQTPQNNYMGPQNYHNIYNNVIMEETNFENEIEDSNFKSGNYKTQNNSFESIKLDAQQSAHQNKIENEAKYTNKNLQSEEFGQKHNENNILQQKIGLLKQDLMELENNMSDNEEKFGNIEFSHFQNETFNSKSKSSVGSHKNKLENLNFPKNTESKLSFKTASGIPLNFNENLNKAKNFFDNNNPLEKNSSSTESCKKMAFTTGSCKPIEISEKTLNQMKQLLMDDVIPEKNNSGSSTDGEPLRKMSKTSLKVGFTTASSKPIEISNEFVKKSEVFHRNLEKESIRASSISSDSIVDEIVLKNIDPKVPNDVLDQALQIYENIKDYHHIKDDNRDDNTLQEAVNFFETEESVFSTSKFASKSLVVDSSKHTMIFSADEVKMIKSPCSITDMSSSCTSKSMLDQPYKQFTQLKGKLSNLLQENKQTEQKKGLGPRKIKYLQISNEKIDRVKRDFFDESPSKSMQISTPIKPSEASCVSLTPLNRLKALRNDQSLVDSAISPIKKMELQDENEMGDSLIVLKVPVENTKVRLQKEYDKLKRKMETIGKRWENLEKQLKSIEYKEDSLRRYTPGCLIISKESRRHTRLPIGKPQNTPKNNDVNIENTLNLHFNLSEIENEFLDEIVYQNGAVLVPNEGSFVGFEEIKNAFLNMPGVDPQKIPKDWLENHYKLIFWKLNLYDRIYVKYFQRCLTIENIINQLKYRYDREIYNVKRGILQQIFEGDESSTVKMVLCVCNIINDNQNIELELTDGWYKVKTILDYPLKTQVEQKNIAIGTKMLIQSAFLENSVQCHPLEASENSKLQIFYNSTRKGTDYMKLGKQKDQIPFAISLKSIKEEGGKISCLKIFVARKYPFQYVESTKNGFIWRNETAERKKQIEFDKNYEEKVEKIREEIWEQFQKEMEQEKLEIQHKKIKLDKESDSQTLYEYFEKNYDPEAILDNFTEEQLKRLSKYKDKLNTKQEIEFKKRVDDKIKTVGFENRKVSCELKLLVLDESCAFKNAVSLSIFNPDRNLNEYLIEGCFYLVFDLIPKKMGVKTTSKSVFKKINLHKNENNSNPNSLNSLNKNFGANQNVLNSNKNCFTADQNVLSSNKNNMSSNYDVLNANINQNVSNTNISNSNQNVLGPNKNVTNLNTNNSSLNINTSGLNTNAIGCLNKNITGLNQNVSSTNNLSANQNVLILKTNTANLNASNSSLNIKTSGLNTSNSGCLNKKIASLNVNNSMNNVENSNKNTSVINKNISTLNKNVLMTNKNVGTPNKNIAISSKRTSTLSTPNKSISTPNKNCLGQNKNYIGQNKNCIRQNPNFAKEIERSLTKIISLPAVKPIFNQFDTVGVVIKIQIDDFQQNLFLADEYFQILHVKIYNSDSICFLFNGLTPGDVIAALNLVYLPPKNNFGQANANNHTIIKKNCKYNHLHIYFEILLDIVHKKCDFVENALQMVEKYEAVNLNKKDNLFPIDSDSNDESIEQFMSSINI